MFTLGSGAVVRPITGTDTTALPTPTQTTSPTTAKPPTKRAVSKGESNNEDQELLVVTSRVPLKDIVSKQRIQMCVRSTRCSHIESFDYHSFCHVNQLSPEFFDRLELTDNRFDVLSIAPNKPGDVRFKVALKQGKNRNNSGNLKLTRKRKNIMEFKCPVCNVKFFSSELIHDDFMATVLANVPEDVDLVELDDEGNVKIVREGEKNKEQEVISIEDLEYEEDDGSLSDLFFDATESQKKQQKRSSTSSEDEKLVSSPRKKKKVKVVDSDSELGFSSFYETDDESGMYTLMIHGTEDDPVVID